MVMMGVKTPRDKMVKISNKGNIVDEDIFFNVGNHGTHPVILE